MKNNAYIFSVLLLFAGRSLLPAADSAYEIIRKSDEKTQGLSSYVEMTMEIIRPTWKRTMSMKGWSKGRDYSMVLITAPAGDKGAASLKRGREMWNWVPTIERVIKIAPSMLSQSWMGSDFTNDDLINQSSIVVDYTHSLLREEIYDQVSCWVIEALPKPDAPVVWGKIVMWVSQGEYNQRKAEFYDEFGDLINVMNTTDVKVLGGRRIPALLEMAPLDKPGQKTVLIYHKAEFDFDISSDFFSLEKMKEIRQ